jgi:Bacterial regulatory helix-turn-helix protein, lysR family
MNADRGLVGDGDLRLLVSAACTGSFTAAAKEARIGQSAVSHAIARLERAIGSRLFERRSTGVTLTDIGMRRRGFDTGKLNFTAGRPEMELKVEQLTFSLGGDVTSQLETAEPFVFGMNTT